MSFSRSPLAPLGLALLAPLSAAGTLTVGPPGSGAQFTEIQAAIDAALADDVILVQPGTYQRFVADKPLRILGDGAGTVLIAFSAAGILVHDIPAGQEFVLSGVRVEARSFHSTPAVLLQNCPGTVVLEDVDIPDFDEGRTAVLSDHCARSLLLDSRLVGGDGSFPRTGAVVAKTSGLWVANADVNGANASFDGSAPAIDALDSTLHVWRSRLRGGSGGITFPKTGGPGGEGIRATNSTLDLFGGPTSEITGGTGAFDSTFNNSFPGGPGLDLRQSSRARIQDDIPIRGGLDGRRLVQAPDVQVDGTSSKTLDPKVFPTLTASAQQVQLGSTFTVTLEGNPGGYQVLFLSLHTGPTTSYRGVDGFGLLDRTSMVKVASEVLPPSAAYTLQLRVPNNLALLGATLFFQGAEQLGRSYAIGNPALVTITR